jgi:hypothetical protein
MSTEQDEAAEMLPCLVFIILLNAVHDCNPLEYCIYFYGLKYPIFMSMVNCLRREDYLTRIISQVLLYMYLHRRTR